MAYDHELDLRYGGYGREVERTTDVCGCSSAETDVVELALRLDDAGLDDCNLLQLEEARDALDVCRREDCDNHADAADDALRALERAIRKERARIEALDEAEADAQGPDCCRGANCARCVGDIR